MKGRILFLSLLIIGGLHARMVQYAIINKMNVPIQAVVVYYGIVGSVVNDWYQIGINESNQPGGLQPNKLFVWNAQNTQIKKKNYNKSASDAYAQKIIVTPQGKDPIQTNLLESYDDMYWVIQPDGIVKRVYQIYYDGTIIPFKNDDHTQGPVEQKDYIKPDQNIN